jgi:uncharacterized protein
MENKKYFFHYKIDHIPDRNIILFEYENIIFLYDRDTELLFEIPNECLPHIIRYVKEGRTDVLASSRCAEFIRIIQNSLKLKNNTMNSITIRDISKVSEENYLKLIGGIGLTELILETSNACNFRCRYCIFSGLYNDFRLHGNDFMSIDVAKKAVDLYYKLFETYKYLNPLRDPKIGFYGGEPLLNINLIENIVEYAGKLFAKYKENSLYTLTTNGSLLGKYAEFLLQNNFQIFVSIDGPKEIHDAHRILVNGTPTFDLIMSNIEQYYKTAEKLGKQTTLFAMATLTLKSDLFKVREFFNKVRNKIMLAFATFIRPFDMREQYTLEDYYEFQEMEKSLREEFLDYVRNRGWMKEEDIFFNVYYGQRIILAAYRYKVIRPMNEYIPFGSSCLPLYRIFVNTQGAILPCEKSPTNLVVGDVFNGINYESIQKIIKTYSELQLHKCSKCQIKFSCRSCIATIYPMENIEQKCAIFRRGVIDDLTLLIQVIKTNRDYIEYLRRNVSRSGSYLYLFS